MLRRATRFGRILAVVTVAAVFCACFACVLLLPSPAYANSAQRYSEGVDAAGVVARGESPVQIESELLTFDIAEFPYFYSSDEDFFDYGGKVTAKYTFVNPSEQTVTSDLCFPFGKLPSYAPMDNSATDAQKYGVKVDGESADVTIRHTYADPYGNFDVDTDLELLHDSYIEDEVFNSNLKVVKYAFEVLDVQSTERDNQRAAFEMENDDCLIYFPEMDCLGDVNGKNVTRAGAYATVGKEMEIYALCKSGNIPAPPRWKFYEDGGLTDGTEIYGLMSAPVRTEMTYEEFALNGWDEQSAVTKVDWYNAVTQQLLYAADGWRNVITLPGYANTLYENLNRWYEYKLTFAPGARVVNEVTAPIYPTINHEYTPNVYTYTYLLSPARTWSKFGTLTININTPYYLPWETELTRGFERTETGYTATFDALPNGELYFSLCEQEDPSAADTTGDFFWAIMAIMLFMANVLGAIFNVFAPLYSSAAFGVFMIMILPIVIIKTFTELAGIVLTVVLIATRKPKNARGGAATYVAKREDGADNCQTQNGGQEHIAAINDEHTTENEDVSNVEEQIKTSESEDVSNAEEQTKATENKYEENAEKQDCGEESPWQEAAEKSQEAAEKSQAENMQTATDKVDGGDRVVAPAKDER